MDYDGLRRLKEQLEKINQTDEFFTACAKELAARLLAKTIKRTPVGDYPKSTGKTGGTLRRGWTAGQNANAKAYAESLPVQRVGGDFVIDIINPVEYASYVEYGHRTANHKGWVEGKFMLTISAKEVQDMAPRILERRLADYLRRWFS